jgi:hypothetical protein
MIKTPHPEQLIDAMEAMVLAADADDLLAAPAGQLAAAALEVRGIANRSLASGAPARKNGRTSRGPGPLIDYLKRLVTARPEVSPNLAAAFAAGKSPSQDEAEALAVELLKARLSSPMPGRKRRIERSRG